MSAWALYPEVGREILASSRANVGPPEPGAFAGIMGAVGRAFPAAYNEAMSAITGVATEYGRAAALTYGAKPSESVDLIGSPAPIADSYRASAKALIPDPLTTGAASRFVFDATRLLTKAAVTGVAGGVPGAVLGTGALEGTIESQKLRDQGVDAMTAAKVGAIKGVSTGIALALPIAGRTLLETAGLVIAGGPVSFMAEKAAARAVLEHADYSAIAHEYDPFDPMGLALSVAVPGMFGAAVHGARAVGAARASRRASVSPEEVDAARTVQIAQHVDETRLADPQNARGADNHIEALTVARSLIDAGERVNVAEIVARSDVGTSGRARLDTMGAALTEAQVSARAIELVRAEAEPVLIAQAGASDVPIAGIRAQVTALEGQIRELTGNRATTIKDTARDLQSQREMKFQDARAEATRLFEARLTDLEASSGRLLNDLERARGAEAARQELGTLAGGDIPPRLQPVLEKRTADLRKALDEKPLAVAVREAFAELETRRAPDPSERLPNAPGAVARPQGLTAGDAPGSAPRSEGGPAAGQEAGKAPDGIAEGARTVAEQSPDMRVIDELTGEPTSAAALYARAEEAYRVDALEARAFTVAVSCFLRAGA